MKPWLLILSLAGTVVFGVWRFNQVTAPVDPAELHRVYELSQYTLGDKYQVEMSDSQLYQFTGLYLAKGGDPTQVNFAHPPLAKQIIGVMFFLTGRPLLVNLVVLFLTFYLMLVLALRLGVDGRWQQMGMVGLLLVNPVYTGSFLSSYLDIFTAVFFMALLVILTGKLTNVRVVGAGVLIGMILSTKYGLINGGIILSLLGYLVMVGAGSIRQVVSSLLIAGITFLISYLPYFASGHNLVEFAALQKYVISWWTGNPLILGENVRMLVTGRYSSWWDGSENILSLANWSIVTPVVFILGLISVVYCGVKAIKKQEFVVILFTAMYLGYMLVIPPAERYWVVVFPSLSLLTMVALSKIAGNGRGLSSPFGASVESHFVA